MHKPSELPLAADGSLYHIHLTAGTLADKVLLVGDPERVDMFKGIFDSIEHESRNRELHAVTGSYHGTRMTALSTGMGCDNIDIVMTELDAAANIDFETCRQSRRHTTRLVGRADGIPRDFKSRSLQIIRIGTSGSLQEEIDCGSHVAAEYAVGLDGLMNYYKEWRESKSRRVEESKMEEAFISHLAPLAPQGRRPQFSSDLSPFARPYCVEGSRLLLDKIAPDMYHGITATAPGFYGPQGRTVRLHPAIDDLNEKLASFQWSESQKVEKSKSREDSSTLQPFDSSTLKVTNLEMETSAIYGFSHLMGHEALTVCLIIANRPKGTFLSDYHELMRQLVGTVVERFT